MTKIYATLDTTIDGYDSIAKRADIKSFDDMEEVKKFLKSGYSFDDYMYDIDVVEGSFDFKDDAWLSMDSEPEESDIAPFAIDQVEITAPNGWNGWKWEVRPKEKIYIAEALFDAAYE
jgi:hypothetical protein